MVEYGLLGRSVGDSEFCHAPVVVDTEADAEVFADVVLRQAEAWPQDAHGEIRHRVTRDEQAELETRLKNLGYLG